MHCALIKGFALSRRIGSKPGNMTATLYASLFLILRKNRRCFAGFIAALVESPFIMHTEGKNMKKIFAVLIAAFLAFGALPGYAETDLSGYSSAELLDLRNQINAELVARGIEKETLVPVGIYVIGVDIPAGDYTIRPRDNAIGGIAVYKSAHQSGLLFTELIRSCDNDIIGKLSLADGNCIEIYSGALYFSPYQGLGF